MNRKTIIAYVVGLIGVGFGVGVLASTVTGAPVPMAFPYQGVLEQDGVLFDGVDVPFDVSLASACPQTGSPTIIWGPESHLVDVQDGRFALQIGSIDTIDPTLLEASTLFVVIDVQPDGEWVHMGCQQLLSAPYAVQAHQLGSGTNRVTGLWYTDEAGFVDEQVDRNAAAFNETEDLGPADDRVCFVTHSGSIAKDSGNDGDGHWRHDCQVHVVGGRWVVQLIVEAQGWPAWWTQGTCTGRCLRWR